MNKCLPEAFHPNLGISSIFAVADTAEARLPEDSRLQPLDAGVEAQLRAMLQAETFDAMILGAVRPEIFDRNVLGPLRFHLLRDGVIQRLELRLATTRGFEEREELQQAIELLRQRAREHELGEALRYALIKG